MKEPFVGQKIYVPSSYYVYRGADDFIGGLATISHIETHEFLPHDHCNYIMVGIKERPSTMYNWMLLLEEQDVLRREYKDREAHSEPDVSPEFNQPDADWS